MKVRDHAIPRHELGYGWAPIPPTLAEGPIFLYDVDGTLRGDVRPMVELAKPLVPDYLGKATLREPLNTHKVARFVFNLGKLWTLRTVNRQQRRRYKRVFSELHNLAGALLGNHDLDELRARYSQHVRSLKDLWSDGAVELLRRSTAAGVVLLVTGSEQLQSEECVRVLSERGVATDRIFVRGSLYEFDAGTAKFTGRVGHLNVTLQGKREVLQTSLPPGCRVACSAGNSRPDRALFEVTAPRGACLLVCANSVLQGRKQSNYVIRRLSEHGYHVVWDAPTFLDAMERYAAEGGDRPVLATDRSFNEVLQSDPLWNL